MWTLETHRVARSSGGRLVLDAKAIYGPPDSVRFFLTNHQLASGSRPCWYQTFSDSTLHWSSTPGAADASVEAAVRPTCVDLNGANHVRVVGLKLVAAASQGVKVSGRGIHVERCELVSTGLAGISVNGRDGVFAHNLIVGASNGAVVGYGPHHRIEGNAVLNTALARNFGPDGMGNGCCGGRAIDISGDSLVIARNTVDSTGYIGIGFRGQYSLVEENVVSHSCMTTDDCGGIYTYVGNYDSAGSRGTVIRRNIVRDGVGAHSGWPHPWEASQGIYLDDGSHDIRVDSNTCSGNSLGLFLHNTRRVTARGNVLYGNRAGQISLSHDGLAGAGDMFENRLESNLSVAMAGQWEDVQIGIHQAQGGPLGTWSDNTVCSDQILSASCRRDGLPIWERERVTDLDPRLGPETQRNGRFDSVSLGWSAWPAQTILSKDSGAACGGGKCLKAKYVGDTVSRSPLANCSRTLSTASGQAWRLSFRARGLNPGQILHPTFRRSSGDYAPLGFSMPVSLDTAWTTYGFLFHSTATEAAARVDFHNSKLDSIYWLDDVSLRSVPESLAQARPVARLVVNSTGGAVSASLEQGAWMDAWGDAQGPGLALAPWQSKVVFGFEGRSAIVARQAVEDGPRATRGAGGWVVEGLREEAVVFDARGRILARLRPDSDGMAVWNSPGRKGHCWLRSGRQTLPLFQFR